MFQHDDLMLVAEFFRSKNFKVTVKEFGTEGHLYSFLKIQGHGIIAGLTESNNTHSIINGSMAMDNEKTFISWERCPVNIVFPVVNLNSMLPLIDFLGSTEGEGLTSLKEFFSNFTWRHLIKNIKPKTRDLHTVQVRKRA
jgi:hypothetical protein